MSLSVSRAWRTSSRTTSRFVLIAEEALSANTKRYLSTTTSPRVSARRIGWKRTREDSLRFLQQVQSKNLPAGIACFQARDLLIQLVNTNVPNSEEKGPAAARLLNAGLRSLHGCPSPEERRQLRGKLYQLTVEAWIGTTAQKGKHRPVPRESFAQAERLVWDMLQNSHFLCKNVWYNVQHINGAFASFVFGVCKAEGQRPLSNQTKARLQPFLNAIEQLWDDPRIPLVPCSPSVDAILYYLYSGQRAAEADQLLQRVMETRGNPYLQPTPHGISTVMSAHAKEGNVERIKEILDLLSAPPQQQQQFTAALPPPNVVSFNVLLDAIVQRGGREAGEQADHVLEWMQQLGMQPDDISYTTAILAWAKGGHTQAAERAEAILQRCAAPSKGTFSAVIHAWSLSGHPDALDKSLGVIKLMNEQHETIPKDDMSYVFNSLIMAFARTQQEDAGDKALECLHRMEQLELPITAGTHNCIMTAMMKSGQHQRALEYFLDLESQHNSGVELDVISFSTALNALSRCNRDTAPAEALAMLQRMMEKDAIEPDSVTFNTVIKILARSSVKDAALRCEQLLEEMQRPPFSETTRPSAFTYASCITAWGYTRVEDRYDRMTRLLHQMLESYQAGNRDAKPTTVPFNNVLIACCCSTDTQERALRCVLECLDLLRRTPNVGPNRNTYPLVIRAIGLNTRRSERRHSLLQKELENCARDGLVCPETLSELDHFAPNLLASHFPHPTSSFKDTNDIPYEWKRNVT